MRTPSTFGRVPSIDASKWLPIASALRFGKARLTDRGSAGRCSFFGRKDYKEQESNPANSLLLPLRWPGWPRHTITHAVSLDRNWDYLEVHELSSMAARFRDARGGAAGDWAVRRALQSQAGARTPLLLHSGPDSPRAQAPLEGPGSRGFATVWSQSSTN